MLYLDNILQLLLGHEPPQVIRNQRLAPLRASTRRMRRNHHIGGLPKPTPRRQRLDLEHIQRRASNLALLQRIRQRILVHRRSSTDVDHPRVLGQQLQPLGVERVSGRFRTRQDQDQGVRLGEQLRQAVLGVDLHAVAHARAARHAFHVGAQADQVRGEGFGDVAEAPDEHARVAQRGECPRGSVRLGAAEVLRPFALQLIIAHLEEPPRGREEETEGVLGDGEVVQAGARGDFDPGGVEAGRQDVVGARGEGLDPAEVREAGRGVFEVLGRVCPGDENVGVGVFIGDELLDVVGLQVDREAVDAGHVEDERRWVEELDHFGYVRASVKMENRKEG